MISSAIQASVVMVRQPRVESSSSDTDVAPANRETVEDHKYSVSLQLSGSDVAEVLSLTQEDYTKSR